jgi:hypothetical protein
MKLSYDPGCPPVHQTHLRDTQDAFDSVTADYDGSRGNNELIQDMRAEMWSWLDKTFAPNSRLIDLGCAIGMNKHTIWTRYYTPREFYRAFEHDFTLDHYRGLCVFAPPPYLTSIRDEHPRFYERLWHIDRRTAHWPLLRSMGDHFLIVMKKRS